MAQVISANLASEQERSNPTYYRHIYIAKRYWDAGTSSYKWDTEELIDSKVLRVSTAKFKLDTGGFNEFKSPNFQVEVDNTWNEWSESESSGVWQTGTNAPYIPELSRVRVVTGQILPDGSEATGDKTYTFSGVIGKPIAYHDQERTATLYAVGTDELLRRVSAEDLSQTATDELLGSDSGDTFTTDENGVGRVLVVKKGTTGDGAGAATELEPDTDYQVSSLNEYGLPATIELTTPLTAGQSLWASYIYWYADKDLSWVVEQALALTDVTSYEISPTIFANSIENEWLQSTQAEFNAGTLQNIDTDYVVDSIRREWFNFDDFEDGDIATNPTWLCKGATTGWSVSGGVLTAASPANWLYAAHADFGQEGYGRVDGVYEIEMLPSSGYVRFYIAATTSGIFIPPPFYAAPWGIFLELDGTNIMLKHNDRNTGESTLYSFPFVPASGDRFRLRLNTSEAKCYIYYNTGAGWNLLNIGGTDVSGKYDQYGYMVVRASGSATFDNIFYRFYEQETLDDSTADDAVFVSQVLDTGLGAIVSWGSLTYNATLRGGSVLVETYSSDSSDFTTGNDAAGWVELSDVGLIQSAVKRYLKVRLTLTPDPEVGTTDGPEVSDFTARYYTSTTTLPLVDCSGMSVYDVIVECAKFCSYEIGFKSDDTFFYRPRTTDQEPVLTLSAMTNLRRENSFNSGRDRIYNRVEASFGDYKEVVDCVTEGETRPHSIDRDGVRSYSISGSFLPRQGANIAAAAASTIYAYSVLPRLRAQVEIKYLLQLELGDVVTYEREHKFGRWLWGDGRFHFGDVHPDFIYYDSADLASWDYNMRVEGIEFETDPRKWGMRLDLVRNL